MGAIKNTLGVFLLLALGFLFVPLSYGQTPGKEEIVIDLPTEYRWKRSRVRKDTPSIREFVHHVSGRNAENSLVKSVRINTIDRRYFPMSSASAPVDKLNFHQQTCPDATLEIIQRQMVDTRNSVLFSIQSDTDGYCGETIFLSLAAEGPTAYHTIELEIKNIPEATSELARWKQVLLDAVIK